MHSFTRSVAIIFALQTPVAVLAGTTTDDLGAKIAQQGTAKGVPPCMACHGPDGAGMAPNAYPRIAGLNADHMARQLRDFRTGKRNNPVMTPMAKGLTDEEITAVSAYYAAMAVPSLAAQAATDEVAKTAMDLVRWGDWTGRGLPACAQCHAPDGQGIGSYFPGIAGQHASYITAQLRNWRSGARANESLGLMKAVADKLTDAEIDAVAAYYAAQPGAAPIPTENAPQAASNNVNVAEGEGHQGATAGREADATESFQSPARDDIPGGPFGEAIRRGEAIFENTNAHPVSSKFVGNKQACGNCHIDAGRLAESAPLWAAWVAYPAYRSKNKKVNTYIERIQGCFRYSMNAQASAAGGPPAADDDTVVALVAYSFWLSKGAPTGDGTMAGRGYPRLKETNQGSDPERGAAVYAAKCALCHGGDGAGVTQSDGRTLFPALWGPGSYNWGAGMHKIDVAAAFIKHNMPLGLPDTLSDQEAWDVAAFMNSRERPQDPRHQGNLATTTAQFHGGKFDYYGKSKTADGHLLGERPSSK